jgi:hypothetical protein
MQVRAEHVRDVLELRPAAAKPSSQGFLGKSIGGGWPLSSPVQVSIRTVCLGVRTTKVW